MDLARMGRWEDVTALVSAQPHLVSLMDEGGNSLLHICAGAEGAAECMKVLIALGADTNFPNFAGSRPLADAIVGGSETGLTTLPELRMLLNSGADPRLSVDAGHPALHWAISQYRLQHARVLLEMGADPHQPTQDDPPETAFDVAQRMGYRAAADLLNEYRKP
jgi:ankyrin repeat protein